MMAMSERNHPGCVAESPLRHGRQAAAGGTSLRGFFIFFARSAQARHVLVEEGTQSIFTDSSQVCRDAPTVRAIMMIHLAFHFDIQHQFKGATTTKVIKTSQQYQQSSFSIRHLFTTVTLATS